jgi:hypothetical protein
LRARIAQAIRAVLLASAIDTALAGLRLRAPNKTVFVGSASR